MEFNRKRNSGSVVLEKSYVNPLFSSTEDISNIDLETQSKIDTNKKIEDLTKEIVHIKSEISEIKKCLEKINEGMINVKGSCNNMDRHISFIDGVYSTIRKPMEFIFNKISYISGNDHLELAETPK